MRRERLYRSVRCTPSFPVADATPPVATRATDSAPQCRQQCLAAPLYGNVRQLRFARRECLRARMPVTMLLRRVAPFANRPCPPPRHAAFASRPPGCCSAVRYADCAFGTPPRHRAAARRNDGGNARREAMRGAREARALFFFFFHFATPFTDAIAADILSASFHAFFHSFLHAFFAADFQPSLFIYFLFGYFSFAAAILR